MLEWIRFMIAALCILVGLFFVGTALLGILFVLLGCIILIGWKMDSLKYLLVILFFWFAGPVSSHLIARLEVTTDEDVKKECEVEKR